MYRRVRPIHATPFAKHSADSRVDLSQLDTCHADAAEQGQTRPPALDEVVKLHFVTMIQKDGCLYELDGRSVLESTCELARSFVLCSACPASQRVSVLASASCSCT